MNIQDEEKFIKRFTDESALNAACDDEVKKFVETVKSLAKDDNVVALDALGFASYGGNRAFPCDWNLAEKCFLKLIELTDETFYVNALGYIYYYGRTAAPDYKKAFHYFSIAALDGVYESQYKIADMLIKGVPYVQNIDLAGQILEKIYRENLELFLRKNYDCKFADIALRIGTYIKDCVIPDSDKFLGFDYEKALHYYLQAKFAIQKRIEVGNFFGDGQVVKNIEEAIEEVSKSIVFQNDLSCVTGCSLGKIFPEATNQHTIIEVKISNDHKSFHVTAVELDKEPKPAKLFVTIADANFCNLVDSFDVILDKDSQIEIFGIMNEQDPNRYIINHSDGETYGTHERPMFSIHGSYHLDLS